MDNLNLSESIFEEFCKKYYIKFERVNPCDLKGEKSPDYIIFVGREQIIVEVKQMDSNPEETHKHQEFERKGIVTIKSKPGHRVRGKITDAMGKFKKCAENGDPSLLLLYDNVKYYKHTNPLEILSAMYGQPYVPISYADTTGQIQIGNIELGGNRGMTREINTSISAIGVLKKESDGIPTVEIYHNIHAKIPFPSKKCSHIPVKQYTIEHENPSGWHEIDTFSAV